MCKLVHDKEYTFVDSRIVQVTTASFTWQQLRIEYQAVQKGYVQVLVANESEKAA